MNFGEFSPLFAVSLKVYRFAIDGIPGFIKGFFHFSYVGPFRVKSNISRVIIGIRPHLVHPFNIVQDNTYPLGRMRSGACLDRQPDRPCTVRDDDLGACAEIQPQQ